MVSKHCGACIKRISSTLSWTAARAGVWELVITLVAKGSRIVGRIAIPQNLTANLALNILVD